MDFVDLREQQRRLREQIDAAIARVLDHGQYIMGPEVAQLEEQLAAHCGATHCISCASGTDGLMMALMALDVGPGDAVFCPAFTFAATVEVVSLVGATPVFVDVHGDTFNLDAGSFTAAIATAGQRELRPAALIAVDLFGLPADYDRIAEVAAQADVVVIADAAQSFGGAYHGRPVGTLAPVTATSFFPAKPLGAYGDGGALFTDDDALATRLRSIREHGKGAEKYDHERIGLNSRLDTIQAAVLLEKLTIFDAELVARSRVADAYGGLLESLKVTVPHLPPGLRSAWAQYTIKCPAGSRDGLRDALLEQNVPTAIYYPRPLHRQPAYRSCPTVADGPLPVSEALADQVLSLPMHPYLSPSDQERIADIINRFCEPR